MAERLPSKQKVADSNSVSRSKKTVKIASVAQWLECLLAKEKAVGSNPITRSNKFALVVQLNRTPVYGTGNQGLNPCRGTIQIFHAGFV